MHIHLLRPKWLYAGLIATSDRQNVDPDTTIVVQTPRQSTDRKYDSRLPRSVGHRNAHG